MHVFVPQAWNDNSAIGIYFVMTVVRHRTRGANLGNGVALNQDVDKFALFSPHEACASDDHGRGVLSVVPAWHTGQKYSFLAAIMSITMWVPHTRQG